MELTLGGTSTEVLGNEVTPNPSINRNRRACPPLAAGYLERLGVIRPSEVLPQRRD